MKKLLFLLLLPVLAFGQGAVVNKGIHRYQVQFIRPNNGTAYTAGDIVADSTTGGSVPLKFAVTSPAGVVVAARLEADTVNTTNATFRLHLMADSAGLGLLTDNGAFTPVFTGKAYDSLSIGYINFTLQNAGTAGSQVISHYITDSSVDIPFRLPGGVAAQKSIWGVLTATGAWTPKLVGKIRLTLWIDQR